MPDSDGYPTKKELERVANWPLKAFDYPGLIDYVRDLWWPQGDPYGWSETDCEHAYFRVPGRRVAMSTGGWSGNEDLIEALHRACKGLFWATCWLESRRGGHYVFEVAKPKA